MGLVALITLHIVCPSTFVTSLIRDILHSWKIEKTIQASTAWLNNFGQAQSSWNSTVEDISDEEDTETWTLRCRWSWVDNFIGEPTSWSTKALQRHDMEEIVRECLWQASQIYQCLRTGLIGSEAAWAKNIMVIVLCRRKWFEAQKRRTECMWVQIILYNICSFF